MKHTGLKKRNKTKQIHSEMKAGKHLLALDQNKQQQ